MAATLRSTSRLGSRQASSLLTLEHQYTGEIVSGSGQHGSNCIPWVASTGQIASPGRRERLLSQKMVRRRWRGTATRALPRCGRRNADDS
ncbi:hypothetical protein EJB05_55133, partial [Eragrostis curvula]